jgi:hypothetical protein
VQQMLTQYRQKKRICEAEKPDDDILNPQNKNVQKKI